MNEPLTEVDLALLHSLQINPRATWSMVGSVIGITEVTAARHWERLCASGAAWITAYPGSRIINSWCVALVNVDCEMKDVDKVGVKLAGHPEIVAVDLIAGEHTFMLTMVVHDLSALRTFVLEELSQITQIHNVNVRVATHMFSEGSQWRLQSLSPAQIAEMARVASPSRGARVTAVSETDQALFRALGADGRLSGAQLADLLGISPATVRRRLERLVRARAITFRCEIAQPLAGWPLSVHYWYQVPAAEILEVASVLSTLPQVRLCVSLGGPANLLASTWVRSPADALVLETRIAAKFKQISVADRAIILRGMKRMGALLDSDGRRIGHVPMATWVGSV